MTHTEQLLIGLLVTAVLCFIFGLWIFAFVLLGIIIVIGAASKKEIPSDPATMAIVSVFGRPSRSVLISRPRIVFAYSGFPLYEDLIPIPMGKLNWDFDFRDVTTGMNDLADGDPATQAESGGRVQVQVSWTGQVKKNAEDAYRYVQAGREAGAYNIFEDRLGEDIRTHAFRRKWETFVGEKKPLSAKLNGTIEPWLADLGLDRGTINVKNIEPEGELKKDAERTAREVQQRRAEKADTATSLANAEAIVAAALAKGQTIPIEEAMKIDRVNRGRAREVIVRSDSRHPMIIASAMREGHNNNGDDDGHSFDTDGGH